MKKANVPTNCTWTATALIEALMGIPDPDNTVLNFVGKSTPATTSSASGTCWCGCGTPTAAKFAPGHDAKFHGLAKKVARGQAAMPESFVCAEAEADFMKWVERTRNEDAAKGIGHVVRQPQSAVIRTIVPEPSEDASHEDLVGQLDSIG